VYPATSVAQVYLATTTGATWAAVPAALLLAAAIGVRLRGVALSPRQPEALCSTFAANM
jgi:hypothetical protein